MLPNASFYWLKVYPRADVHVHPLTRICKPAWELKCYDFTIVDNPQLNILITSTVEIGCQSDK